MVPKTKADAAVSYMRSIVAKVISQWLPMHRLSPPMHRLSPYSWQHSRGSYLFLVVLVVVFCCIFWVFHLIVLFFNFSKRLTGEHSDTYYAGGSSLVNSGN